MIEFRNVSKTYKTGTEAVHNANFVIEKGEFAFLVGSSGSGKSTLIKLILKEEEPTKGNIIINGKDTTFLKPKRIPFLRRSMGVVFQDFRLLPDRTVYDNVAYAMYIVRATPKILYLTTISTPLIISYNVAFFYLYNSFFHFVYNISCMCCNNNCCSSFINVF